MRNLLFNENKLKLISRTNGFCCDILFGSLELKVKVLRFKVVKFLLNDLLCLVIIVITLRLVCVF